jgi:hypothetical protein
MAACRHGAHLQDRPIAINPNITGSEFASAVRTLHAAERRLIEAKLREMARIRTL